MSQISTAGLTLPDVILLDAEATTLNPYEFCRWCRDTFPNIQIFLTRFQQMHVSDTERRWAKQQGANDFLSGFNRHTLMSHATENVKRILTSLDHPFLNENTLLTVLLNIRRQLSTTQTKGQTPAAQRDRPESKARELPGVVAAPPPQPISANAPDPLNDVAWVTSGLRALDNSSARKIAQESFASPPPAVKSSSLPKPIDNSAEKVVNGAVVRRYRGVVY
ncbi:response regulator [Nodosilinea sp. LEGE 07088]|nr:response regulator [Nodosilinea sp. LEGE 07088]